MTDEAQVQPSLRRRGRSATAASTWRCNNAGLGGQVEVVEMTDEQWSTVLDVTLTGTFRCTRAALGHLYAAGRRGAS